MVSFFKERSAPSVFLTVIICLALHVFFLVKPPLIITSPTDGLIYYLLQPLVKLPAVAISILYFLVVIVQALRINYVLNDARMFQKTPFTAALAYIMLTAVWPACNNITGALAVNSLFIWLLFRIVKLYNINQPKTLVFNIGLISGSAVLLYYPAAGIIPLVFIALAITRPFRINEWLVLLLGIITPAYFWGCYLFLTDQLAVLKTVISLIQWQHIAFGPVKAAATALGGAGLVILAGIAGWQSNRNKLIQARKMWSVIFIMLVLALPPVFFIKNAWPYAVLLASVPASALAANAFLYQRGILSALLFWLMAAVIVYVNWLAL